MPLSNPRLHRTARSTCPAAFVCAPQVVAPTNASKLRSSSSDLLSLLALLARPRRSIPWRTSTAGGASFTEHCSCAALQHRRCHAGSQLVLCRPGYARAAVQYGHDSIKCARSCVEIGSLSSLQLTHPCRHSHPHPVLGIQTYSRASNIVVSGAHIFAYLEPPRWSPHYCIL